VLLVLAAIGGGAFFLASTAVSLRLLLLARRTRALPELLIGFGLLVLGSIGYPVAILVETTGDAPTLQLAFSLLHALLQTLGQGAITVFTWRVFRPDAGWARALVYAFFGGVAVLALWQNATPGWAAFAASKAGPWQHLPFFTLFSLGWAGGEALLYHRKLVRRLGLGLADAVATNRMWLWSLSILSAFLISAIVSAMRASGHEMDPRSMGIVLGPLGLVSAGSMWLAFLPPHQYLHWVKARAIAGGV
jgi:hypothetical protein